MLVSMTGQGSASGRHEAMSIEVDVRSVNNRFLKVSSRLSEPVSSLETQLESIVREHLRRGTVTVSIRTFSDRASQASSISQATLRAYVEQFRQATQGLVHDSQWIVEMGAALQLPGVLETSEAASDEALQDAATGLLRQALSALNTMRAAEGRSMQSQLEQSLQEISDVCQAIESRAPGVLEEYARRLETRVRNGVKELGVEIDRVDLTREVVQFSDRCDIREEIVRLQSHIAQFQQSMQAEESQGKRLDFLIQELLREANTIGSKANDAVIAHHVVTIKTKIEQMRELVQNVE
jgi:uncharacterized protein (TIGR00255 family)